MDSLASLAVADWLTICDRYLAQPKRSVNKARSEVASLSLDMITGRLLGKEKGELVHQAALRIRDRAAPANGGAAGIGEAPRQRLRAAGILLKRPRKRRAS